MKADNTLNTDSCKTSFKLNLMRERNETFCDVCVAKGVFYFK